MAALSEYTNVYNTALNLLAKRGFQLWFDPGTKAYCAEKDGWDFHAKSPLGLLGAVAVFESMKPEQWGEYWWRDEPQELFNNLPNSPPKQFTPVYQKR